MTMIVCGSAKDSSSATLWKRTLVKSRDGEEVPEGAEGGLERRNVWLVEG
jgi:hypothetical protein